MPQNRFRQGYLDCWRFLRGAEDEPSVPPYSPDSDAPPYQAGVMRGIRDASVPTPLQGTETSEGWVDAVLRRMLRRSSKS